MKKLIVLALAVTLYSCSDLGKEIKMTEFGDTMKELEKQDTKYSQEDFDKAEDLYTQKEFAGMMSGESTESMTYEELLDKAKAENDQRAEEMRAYLESVEELKKHFMVEFTSGEYVKDDNYSSPHRYYNDFTVKNVSDRTITAFKGEVILTNEKDEELITVNIDETFTLEPSKTASGRDYDIIFEEDNLTELKVLPFDRIKQEWRPSLIFFENGDRMEALDKVY